MINGNGRHVEPDKHPLWAKIVAGILLGVSLTAWFLVVAAMGKAAWLYLAKGSL